MNKKIMVAALLSSAMIVGCEKAQSDEKPAEDTLAVSVNGKVLMQSEIDADIERIVAAQGDKIPVEQLEYAKQQMGNQLVQAFIIEKIFVAKAKEEGVTLTDEDRKEREAELMKSISASKMPNAPKSLDEFYKTHPLGEARARAEFENGILIDKYIKVAQEKAPKKDHLAEAKKIVDNIVSNNAVAKTSDATALAKIKDLKAQLDKVPAAELPAKFAELAKANSACPSKEKGGDLGEFTHGQMVPEFDKAAFELPVNKVSDPIKTQFGYHLVMVTKKIPAVEAKDGKPAEAEKVQASHILIKTENVRNVPKVEDVVKQLEIGDKRTFTQELFHSLLKAAKLEASEAYKRFLPVEEAPVEKTEKK